MEQPKGPVLDRAPIAVPLIPEHELLCPIASGAYGWVWLARNTLGVYRAVKIVHRSSFDHARPFEREFAGIKAFEPISRSHEGLVDLLQVGRDDVAGYLYYVMELADDLRGHGPPQTASGTAQSALLDSYSPRTLASELKSRSRLPLDECIGIGLSLTGALAYLHSQKLVHRDVKPSNIIFVGGVPKLADVGLVALAGEALSFVGTEGFIAPEGPGTPRADLYSLGIVLYVISTGKSHHAFPEPLSDLGAQQDHAQRLEFDVIVHKACQAEARKRYQTAQEMHDELLLLQQGRSVKRKRAAQRRRALGKKLGLAVGALALMALALSSFKYRHTPSEEARREYDLGHWYYNQLTQKSQEKAFEHLNRAVQLDPKFIEPYGQLTAWYVWHVGIADQRQEQHDKVRRIAETVLALDPKRAEGHTALSWSRFLERDYRQAEQEIVRAIQLNPKYPIARDIYCFYLCMLGRTKEAHYQIERSLEVDPTARTTTIVASWPFVAERKFDQAIKQLRRAIELDEYFPEVHSWLARCYEAQGTYSPAIQEFRTFELLDGSDSNHVNAAYTKLQQAYDTSGEQGYLHACIELVNDEKSLPSDQQLFGESDLISCYARLGDKQKALDELEHHLDEINHWELNFDPLLDTLHNEPRFHALLKRAGLVK